MPGAYLTAAVSNRVFDTLLAGGQASVALAAPQGRATARVPINWEPTAVACSGLESDLFQGITVRVSIQIVQEPPL